MKITFPRPSILQAQQGAQRAAIRLIIGSLLSSLGILIFMQSASLKSTDPQPNEIELGVSHDDAPHNPPDTSRALNYGLGSILSAIGLWLLYRALWQPRICMLQINQSQGLIRVEYRSLLRHGQTHYYQLQDALAMAGPSSDPENQFQGNQLQESQRIIVLMNSGEFLALTIPESMPDTEHQKITDFLRFSLET
ncbi:MAG: hypothetical protein ACPGVO_22095 [Spirulinaceae cyanobacterium]